MPSLRGMQRAKFRRKAKDAEKDGQLAKAQKEVKAFQVCRAEAEATRSENTQGNMNLKCIEHTKNILNGSKTA